MPSNPVQGKKWAVQSGERTDWTKLACDRNSKLRGASRRSPRRECHQTMWTRRPRRHSNVTSYPSSQTIVVWSRRIPLRSVPRAASRDMRDATGLALRGFDERVARHDQAGGSAEETS